MFGRDAQAKAKLRDRFSNGWTEEMITTMLGRRVSTRDERSRQSAHVDRVIDLCGFGQALNKFETQRLLWGWVTPSYGPGVIAPAYVRVDIVESLANAQFCDEERDVALSEPDEMLDMVTHAGTRRAPDRPREQVGYALLHSQGGDHVSAKTYEERKVGSIPFFDVRLTLTPEEWAPVRECIEMAQWRGGRGPTFTVRMELPHDLDMDAIRGEPWSRSFKVTRYWIESVVAMNDNLGDHPLFRSAISSGGIGEIF